MEFTPRHEGECAGLVLLQNNDFQMQRVVSIVDGTPVAQLIRRDKGAESQSGQVPVSAKRIYFKISVEEQNFSFYVSENLAQWSALAESEDGRILSTPVAGGFVGTYIVMYASSNGNAGGNHVDWDWFEYAGSE